jgi:tocopherol O-methyltransferase
MPTYNEKEKIRDHYDLVSPYYKALWGEHLHHGYWIRGDETKEKAQLQLIEHLARVANLRSECTLLDVGCGFGASSIYLAERYEAQATGITISPVQVEMANQAARKAKANAKFLCMDAEAMKFKKPFDVVWSVESISHYPNNEKFFAGAAKLLKPNGRMAITDWFKKDGLTPREHRKFLQPIEKGMLVGPLSGYHQEQSVLDPRRQGLAFVHWLKAFKTMRDGYASGNFIYGLMVAEKP